MPPSSDRARRAVKGNRPSARRKVCAFCADRAMWVDYKDVDLMRRFISDRGRIRAGRGSGNCSQHQRELQMAIKTARELALLPYAQRTVSERGAARISSGRTAPKIEEVSV